jgi:hypothetical protein
MSSVALPLSDIVNVTVLVTPQVPAIPTFNVGLVVGPTAVIPASQRTRIYTSTAQMLSDGFTTSSPEYIAAQIYFSQLIPPLKIVIGRQDLTSINTATLGAGGTGNAIGDILTVVQGGAAGGQYKVLTVTAGAVTSIVQVAPGTGYSVANGLATTSSGSGSGATINVTVIGDTPLQAITACRASSTLWWACFSTSAVKADHEAIGAFAQSSTTPMCYFYTTADADALAGTAGNVFSFMKSVLYNRVFGLYSTTQSGGFPNNIYAGAAAMGVAMGLNTGLNSSFFTEFGKTLVGISTEPLSETQVNVMAGSAGNGFGNNGNVYLNYGNVYSLLTQGVVGSAQFFDEILNIDMLTAAIQFNVMNVLTQNPAVPLTDAGVHLLVHAVEQACDAARLRGFIAAGTWNGVQILDLVPGDSLPAGYRVQAPAVKTMSAADRAARKSPPIYAAIVEAGAAQSVIIGVYVQR